MFHFFAVWAGARAPPKQQKNTPPPKQPNKNNTPLPLRSVFCFLLFGRVGLFFFLVLFGWRAFFFFSLSLSLFSVWALWGRVVFTVWAGCVLLFLLFGRGACGFFCAVWARGVFICLLFGRGGVGGGAFVFFAVWAGGMRGGGGGGWGCVFFFAVWAGDGSSLTYRSAWLVFKRPNNKNDQTAKKNNVFPGVP